jgi:molybdate transport system substrate-binding protein
MSTVRTAAIVILVTALWPVATFAQISVLHSGGFAAPYRELLPAFERSSGVTVTSTQAASQGSGPNTIPALLRRGVGADVVILSREGLDELIREGRIVAGSAVELAQSPLGLAVRTGAPKPDITSVEGFKQAVLRARSVNFVSTTAVYMNQKLFPSLGIADAVARKANEDTLADLPGTRVDLVLRPVSEIIHLPGFDFVGPVPAQIQFLSVFTAAVVTGSKQADAAKRLIAFLSSEEALAVAKKNGMESVGSR